MAEIVLSGDSLNTGRIKLNQYLTGTTFLYSSGTGSDSVKLIAGNGSANSSFGFSGGKGNASTGAYCSIFNGSGNTAVQAFAFMAGGKNNLIAGAYGTILNGNSHLVSGSRGFIGNGRSNVASSTYSFVGNGFTCKGMTSAYATVINGFTNTATGLLSLIVNGSLNIASNNHATILNGTSNTASGTRSTVLNGDYNTASGNRSLIFGNNCTASHAYSIAFGKSISSNASYQMVFGSGSRNIRLQFDASNNGIGYFNGGTVNSGADYAEYFEWEDDNVNDEKRYGFGVSLTPNGKIKIGGHNIIGIVSSTPSVVANASEFNWDEKYITDDWGNKKLEEYTSFYYEGLKTSIYIDKANVFYSGLPLSNLEKQKNKIDSFEIAENIKTESTSLPIINPDYRENEMFIPRSKRKEWSIIGLIGRLRIRTAEKITNNYININSDGLAVNGATFHVLKQIKEYDGEYGIIQIFFK